MPRQDEEARREYCRRRCWHENYIYNPSVYPGLRDARLRPVKSRARSDGNILPHIDTCAYTHTVYIQPLLNHSRSRKAT